MSRIRIRRRILFLAIAAAATGLVAGCGSDSDEPAPPRNPAVTGPTATTDGSRYTDKPMHSTGQKDSGARTSSGGQTARDGKWRVGNAGTVEFSLENGEFVQVSANPTTRLDKRVSDQRADETELHFTRRKHRLEVRSGAG